MDPQRHTLSGVLCFTRISYPADPLGMVSAENPNGYTDKTRKSKAEQSAQSRYTHRRNQVHSQSVRKKQLSVSPLSGQLQDVNI